MSKFIIFILGAVLGLIIGGAAILYFISPRAANVLPGNPIQAPDPQNSVSGTAVLQLNQEFFVPIIQTLFAEENSPSFPLNLNGQPGQQPINEIVCGKITLKPDVGGTKSSVKMENGQIKIPMAFTGNFNAFGNCFEFSGWSESNLELRFDEKQQIVFGQVNVQTVNLEGVSPIVSGLLTPIVQSTINSRVNPVEILRGEQIMLKVPIKSTGNFLIGKVKDVRGEVKDGALRLSITYDFSSEKLPPNFGQ